MRLPIRATARRLRRYVPVLARGRWNRGWCPICEARTAFLRFGPHLRRDYQCIRCHSVPRQRALLAVLAAHFPGWRDLRVYEAGPGGPSSDKLRRSCHSYMASHYQPSWEWGTVRDGVRSETLEHLTLEDNCFDLVITQDVFEHVLRPDLAFAEISRVLVPGGAHVFSVPIYQRPATVVRAVPTADGSVEHVLEPKFHKDPVDPRGALVAREWGFDIGDFILAASGMTSTLYCLTDRQRGIDGEHREIVVSRKPLGR